MATFIPQPPNEENRLKLSLEQAKDFANRFCQPKDNDLVEDFDESAREAAWQLLQALEQVQHQDCNEFVCEKCKELEEEESIDEEGTIENEEGEIEDNKKEAVGVEGEKPSTMDKLNEIAEKNKDILDKAAKGTAAAVGAGATVQTASAATGLSAFVQETAQKIGTIGVAGTMSIGSGAYFQAKTSKEKGTEIAVVAEQEHQIFSNLNDFTESTMGFQPFSSVTDTIVNYAENGYGDVIGTSEEGYEGEGGEGGKGEGGEGEGGEGEGGEGSEGEGGEGEGGGKAETKKKLKKKVITKKLLKKKPKPKPKRAMEVKAKTKKKLKRNLRKQKRNLKKLKRKQKKLKRKQKRNPKRNLKKLKRKQKRNPKRRSLKK